MDLMGDIADATIKRLKKEKQFEDWPDEKFTELRTFLTAELPGTEEAIEEYANNFVDFLTREEDDLLTRYKPLTYMQQTVLDAIRENPRTRQDLINDLGIHPQTMHYILKVLKKRKLVKTVTDPTLMDLRKRIYMAIEDD